MKLRSLVLASALLVATGVLAQEPQPAAQRTCQVVDLRDARGEVKFDLIGTVLLPTAAGAAQIEVRFKQAEVPLALKVKGLVSPSRFGEEYLTYVAWRVLESGNFVSLGELRHDGVEAGLTTNVPRGNFGLLITAEPYFAVPQPSDAVVLETRPTVKAAKHLRPVEIKCELLPRGHYAMGRSQESMELLFASDTKTPPELIQARNAVDIARLAGAERFSMDRLNEATHKLLRANALLRDKGAPKQAAGAASEAVVAAEMARQIALQRAVDEAAMIGEVESARRETAAVTAELERARLDGRLEAERREGAELERARLDGRLEAERRDAAELERARLDGRLEAERREGAELRLKDELSLREAMERRREAEIMITPPAPHAERSDLEQERHVVQGEIERMRSELNAERERMMNEIVKHVQTQAELERARMEVALAEERAELKVDRARLEAERYILETLQQRPEPLLSPPAVPAPSKEAVAQEAPAPAVAAEPLLSPPAEPAPFKEAVAQEASAPAVAAEPLLSPPAEPAPSKEPVALEAPAPANAAEPEVTAESAEWQRLSAEISSSQEALIVEQAELRALREELRAELEAARQRETTLAAETSPEAVAEAPEREPAEKRVRWFGRKKADPETSPPAEPVMVVMSSSDLDEERRWIQAEQARLNTERAVLESQRRKLEAMSEQSQPQKRRWWFGPKSSDPAVEPVIVQDSAATVELSRLDAERARMRAEAETERAKLTAERAAFEAEMGVQKAERDTEEKDQQVEALHQRVAELETGAVSEPVDERQAELAASIEQLRAELEQIKTAPRESAPSSPEREQPAWRSDLAELLGAERTSRGLVVRLPDLSFETSKHELRPEAREQLSRVAGILQSAPGARIVIEGHTDSTGDPAFNQRLSELRASAVMNYLVTRSMLAEAMSARGQGDAQPIASNATREGRSRNRRVELFVTGNAETTVENRGGDHGSE